MKLAIKNPNLENTCPAHSARLSWVLAVFLLVMLAGQCLYSAWTMGQTTDETYYNGSGYPMIRYNNYEFLGEHPPFIIQLGALPLLLLQPHFPIQSFVRLPGSSSVDISKTGALFLYKMGNDPQLMLFLERLPIVGLTVLLGVCIFLFAKGLYGAWGSLLALCLYCFCPNIIAHGSLYTTDMGLTVFLFLTIYALKRFFDAPSDGKIMIVGVMSGLAFMSKISGLILLPVIASLFLIYYWTEGRSHLNVTCKDAKIPMPAPVFEKWILGIAIFLIANAIGERQAMVLLGPFLLFAFYLCARDIEKIRNSKIFGIVLKIAVLAAGVLCIIYSVRLKKKYGASTASFLAIGNLMALGMAVLLTRLSGEDVRIRILKFFLAIWVFAALVIVLGYTDFFYKFYRFVGFGNFMKPLGIVLNHSRGGAGTYSAESFIRIGYRYFPAVIAVKTPLLTLLLSGVGALILLLSRRPILVKAMIFVPIVFFLGASMTNKINIGLRHILPIYPFLFLLGGLPGDAIANIKPSIFKKTFAAVFFILVILFAGRTLRSSPDQLAYFNEFVGGPEHGARLGAGANLDWGQDSKRFAEFVLQNKIPFIKIGSGTTNADIYDYYNIPWKMMQPGDLTDPAPGFYALSIDFYISLQKNPRSWFFGKRPRCRVGKTIYIFEVPLKQTATKPHWVSAASDGA